MHNPGLYKKVCIIDGITRIIWLLCNGAKELPFSINTDDAYSLVKEFGKEVNILEEL